MDKQVEQSFRAVSAAINEISGRLTAQDFLLQQAYARWFQNDPGARANAPKQFIGEMRFNATSPSASPEAMEIQSQAIKDLERFFAQVEQSVAQAEWAQQRRQETK
ncbi:hypothetical protein [Cupriavidus nantongensis]